MKQQLTQKQLQRLSPQQLLLTRLVQLNQGDLDHAIREELEKNPLLEEDSISVDAPSDAVNDDMFEYSAYRPAAGEDLPDIVQAEEPDSLDELMRQVRSSGLSEEEIRVAEEIVGSLDENGFLSSVPLMNIAYKLSVEESLAESVLYKVQALAEPGVAARDLQECMLLQLKAVHEEPYVMTIVREYFQAYMAGRDGEIISALDLTDEEMAYARTVIAGLNPKPGRGRESMARESVIPDILLREKEGRFYVSLNQSDTQSVRLSEDYLRMLEDAATDASAKSYLKKHKQSADWFISAIEQRKQSMLLVARALVNRQEAFFRGEEPYPEPMVLKDIAGDTGLDISTVSRIVNGKYLQTPDRIYELKYFFGEGIRCRRGRQVSVKKLEDDIRRIVAAEDKNNPLNDEQIAALLVEQGYEIARRTISKYREKLEIPPSRDRKE